MTGQRIKIAATDGSGEFGAYVAPFPAEPSPGIVMLHEILGITDWIVEVTDQFAARGFCVIAPDMFWRLEPGFVADFRIPEQRDKGFRFRGEIDHSKAIEDIAAAIDYLKAQPQCNGKVAVAGFCMGGTLTYLSATRLKPDAAVVYYGTEVHRFLEEGPNISCPTIFHAGTNDHHVPLDLLNKIRGALEDLPGVAFHIYDAGHAFANTHKSEEQGHSPGATEAAHARSFEFLERLR